MSSVFYSFSDKNSTSIFRVEEFSVSNRKAGHYFDMTVDARTHSLAIATRRSHAIYIIEFHHYFLFLHYRWQLNEIAVQEVAVILQVSKVRRMKRNKNRKRKRRTEGLVCSVQMCECLWVSAVMGHKDTKQLHFLRLY